MRKFMKQLWNDESAQGTSEYILLLVAVVAVAMIFRTKIKEIIDAKMGDVSTQIQGFGTN